MRTANLNKSNNIAQGPQPSETDSSSTPPRHSSSFQPAMQSFASQIRIHGNSDLRPTGKESSLNSDADSDYEWEHSPGPGHQPEWDSVIKKFLSAAGLIQALRGFESDMVILNPDWERKIIPRALGGLLKQLLSLSDPVQEDGERALDQRKLSHIHLREGVQPRSQSSINKDISAFLAKNRARNDHSNRDEFLQPSAEKRKKVNNLGSETIPSCSRVDAKPVDRDLQMQYDIAKNEEGPLRKTVKPEFRKEIQNLPLSKEEEGLLSSRHPALDGRLGDIETHLAVKYVPSPPRLLLDRIKFLEDHIIGLERDYPPWAALHFNQPRRGWPAPPRKTPIIVPPRMVAPDATEYYPDIVDHEKGKGRASTSKRGRGSSLHRAVIERLQVQQAKEDLARGASIDVDEDMI